jgi:hypothetical protein
MTRKAMISAVAVLAAACGGSGPERTTKNFSYESGTTTSASSLSAATDVAGGIQSSTQFRTAPDASAAASIVALPDALDGALDTTVLALQQGLQAPSREERIAASAAARLVSAADTSVTAGCATATPTQVTFSKCSVSASDANGTFTVTLDGTVSKASADEVKWDLTATLSGTTLSGNATASVRYFGDLTVTATSIDGYAESDKKLTASGPSGNVTASVTNSVDFEKVVVDATGCVSGGSVELKRIASVSGASATGSGSANLDRALKLTWQGCGTVLVQHSI